MFLRSSRLVHPSPTQLLEAQSWLKLLLKEHVIESGVAQSASAGVAVACAEGFRCVTAHAGSTRAGESSRERVPTGAGTIYDLASVTKPFVAVAAARLVERGQLAWDTQLCGLLPQSSSSPSAEVTLEHLLSHRAGLKAHLELFAPLMARQPFDRRQALAAALHARRPECMTDLPSAGFAPLYSDLGYILIGEALSFLESVDHERPALPALALDRLVEREVCEPLGLSVACARRWLDRKEANFLRRVAPTEHVRFRGGELRGVVHDENAWALAGHGLAGHAGLFGTLDDMLEFGRSLLDVISGRSSKWLGRAQLEFMLAARPGGSQRLGFDGKSAVGSSAGELASELSFGHLGFTGTSLWCDPKADAVGVLLTNRVCPTRSNTRIRACRPVVHQALFSLAHSLRAALQESAAPAPCV